MTKLSDHGVTAAGFGADTSAYVVATNPTPGTAITHAATQSFSSTAAIASLFGAGRTLLPDYLKLITVGTPTTATSAQLVVTLDQTNRYNSGGVPIIPYSVQRTPTSFETGTATAGGAATLTDDTKTWLVNQHAGRFVRLTGGTGAGQRRMIVSNTVVALTVAPNWAANPDATSVYSIEHTPGGRLHFGDVSATAVSYERIVARSTIKVQSAPCLAVGDVITIGWGERALTGQLAGSTAQNLFVGIPGHVIAPTETMLVHIYYPAVTVAPTFELEMGWWVK